MDVIYFASGSNCAGEIEGFASIGWNPGVCACDIYPAGIEAVKALAGTSTKVFVDSGAFGEVGFGPEGLVVKAPISDEEWNHRLDLYEELAQVLGSQLYVVAPDRVGSQADTLDRLIRYADRVQKIAAFGANVIVVCQKGDLPQAEFLQWAADAVGLPVDTLVAGIPSKKAAATTEEIAAFFRDAQPRRAHLLGLGPKSPRWDEVCEAVAAVAPTVELYCDSVALKAVVGRSNGPGGSVQPLTAALDRAAETVAERMWSEGADGCDYTDNVYYECDEWMCRAYRTRLADGVDAIFGKDKARRRAILASPHDWLATSDEADNDWVHALVNECWVAYSQKRTGSWRKRTAVVEVFGGAA